MTGPRLQALLSFQERAGILFGDIRLLDRALTHRSCLNESKSPSCSNERLEFLGDAVLGEVVAHALYRRLEGRPEGELARVKSFVVSEDSLTPVAESLGIPEALLLGRGEENSGGRSKKALLADALEAVIGAVFLDSGHASASEFVERLTEPRILEVLEGRLKDYKSILQEYAQKYAQGLPVYRVEETAGPEHARLFRVSCTIGTTACGPCEGRTKKDAEQAAAAALYRRILESGGADAERLRQSESRESR